jgi:hypothetical protein
MQMQTGGLGPITQASLLAGLLPVQTLNFLSFMLAYVTFGGLSPFGATFSRANLQACMSQLTSRKWLCDYIF